MESRQKRIDDYFEESSLTLAEWLVDAEDAVNARAGFPLRVSVNCWACEYDIVLRGLYTFEEVRDAVTEHIAVCAGVVR